MTSGRRPPISPGWDVEGLQEVKCRDCGESLGYQGEEVPIDYAVWPHNRCPERLRLSFGITRAEYDRIHKLVSDAIEVSYPEFPRNVIGDPADKMLQELRGNIAAGYVMEVLAKFGYRVGP
jgi:hypothetical protein